MKKPNLTGLLLGAATGSLTTAALKHAAAEATKESYDPEAYSYRAQGLYQLVTGNPEAAIECFSQMEQRSLIAGFGLMTQLVDAFLPEEEGSKRAHLLREALDDGFLAKLDGIVGQEFVDLLRLERHRYCLRHGLPGLPDDVLQRIENAREERRTGE